MLKKQEENKLFKFLCGHSCVLPNRGEHCKGACWHRSKKPSGGQWSCRICSVNLYRKQKYGINSCDVENRLKAQDGCAICHTWMPGAKGSWHIDHDHVTGATRGILCHYCNIGIGNFADNIEKMESALHYLIHHAGLAERTYNKTRRQSCPSIW
jgi:hypothetical protein